MKVENLISFVLVVGLIFVSGCVEKIPPEITTTTTSPVVTTLPKEEVVIKTDKTEYEQGERVKITLSNRLDQTIYYHFPGNKIGVIQQYKEGEWKTVPTYITCPCDAICDIIARLKPLKGDRIAQASWDQKIRWCEDKKEKVKKASTGLYRIKFDYQLCQNRGKEELKPIAISQCDSREGETIYSNEFRIKEKEVLDEKHCKEDEDCVLTSFRKNSCCPAGCQLKAINKETEERWEAWRKINCEKVRCPLFKCPALNVTTRCVNNRCAKEGPVKKVTITTAVTTDKREYQQGENITATLNYNTKIYQWDRYAWLIQKQENDSWITIKRKIDPYLFCSNIPDCKDVNLEKIEECPPFVLCEQACWERVRGRRELRWDQAYQVGEKPFQCNFTQRLPGGRVTSEKMVNRTCAVFEQVPPGKYKIRFEYTLAPDLDDICSKDVNIKYAEKEFIIKPRGGEPLSLKEIEENPENYLGQREEYFIITKVEPTEITDWYGNKEKGYYVYLRDFYNYTTNFYIGSEDYAKYKDLVGKEVKFKLTGVDGPYKESHVGLARNKLASKPHPDYFGLWTVYIRLFENPQTNCLGSCKCMEECNKEGPEYFIPVEEGSSECSVNLDNKICCCSGV